MARYALVLCGEEADIQRFLKCLHETHKLQAVTYDVKTAQTFMGRVTTGEIVNFDKIIDLFAECGNRVQVGITDLEEDVSASFL